MTVTSAAPQPAITIAQLVVGYPAYCKALRMLVRACRSIQSSAQCAGIACSSCMQACLVNIAIHWCVTP